MDGEHCLRAFTNGEIRTQLQSRLNAQTGTDDARQQSARGSRIFRRCHTHGIIAKIPAHGVGVSPGMAVK